MLRDTTLEKLIGVSRLPTRIVVSTEPRELERQIVGYLLEETASGTQFVKSRYVAQHLDVSTKRVGQVMARLEAEEHVTLGQDTLALQRWGGESDGITWSLERLDDGRR